MLTIPMIKTLHMWQSHVENEHYFYHILTTISTLHDCNSAVGNLSESSNLGFSNFNLSARGDSTSGLNCMSKHNTRIAN